MVRDGALRFLTMRVRHPATCSDLVLRSPPQAGVSKDGPRQDAPPRSRHARCARALHQKCRPETEGAGKAGCPNAPAASRAEWESTRVSPPQVHRFTPAFPARLVLTACFALSPVSMTFESPSSARCKASSPTWRQPRGARTTRLRRPRRCRSSDGIFASIASRAQRP